MMDAHVIVECGHSFCGYLNLTAYVIAKISASENVYLIAWVKIASVPIVIFPLVSETVVEIHRKITC